MDIKQPFAFFFFNLVFLMLLAVFYFLQQFLTWEFYVFWFLIYLELIQAAYLQKEPEGVGYYKITYALIGISLNILFLFSLTEYFAISRSSLPISVVGVGLCIAALFIRHYGVKNLGVNFSEHVKKPKKLVVTGLYKYIRHPIYLSSLLYVFGLPLIINSYYSLSASLLVFIFITIRADLEERTLRKELKNYSEYSERTKKFFPSLYRSSQQSQV